MPATCNGCGACCRPVSLGYSQADVASRPERFTEDNWLHILDHLTPITRREAIEIQPWLKEAGLIVKDIDGQLSPTAYYYLCDFHDPVAMRCTNWENRPTLCREYPWIGEPNPQVLLPPQCSYNEDLGRPVKVEIRHA
jgi:Fe-S-cluster containining protein